MTGEQMSFAEQDLTELMSNGVLMAANERFFWPLGLALTWVMDGDKATGLQVRQWDFPTGHIEAIAIAPDDDIAHARREAFRSWMLRRVRSMPILEEATAALAVLEGATQ